MISFTTFRDNHALSVGGAIYCEGGAVLAMARCSFEGNIANDPENPVFELNSPDRAELPSGDWACVCQVRGDGKSRWLQDCLLGSSLIKKLLAGLVIQPPRLIQRSTYRRVAHYRVSWPAACTPGKPALQNMALTLIFTLLEM